MEYKIIIRPEAEKDLTEAFVWYEMNRRGLGLDFLLQVDAGLRFVARVYRRTVFEDNGVLSMAFISDEIINSAKRFLNMLSASGLHLDRAILFGSHAKG